MYVLIWQLEDQLQRSKYQLLECEEKWKVHEYLNTSLLTDGNECLLSVLHLIHSGTRESGQKAII